MSVAVSDLSFSYGRRRALEGVSFEAKEGEVLAVLGPNGAGKSTLFGCILGVLPCYEGRICVCGEDARDLGARELARRIAYIPQSHSPVFNFTVFEVVLMGTSGQISAISVPGKKQIELAEAAMEAVGITGLKDRGFLEISGGERQLALIARALAQDARVLVMDEPTANLDYGNQIRVLTQVRKLAGEGYTVVQSTHNPDQAFMFADKVLAMSKGRVVRFGSPREVISEGLIRDLYGVDVSVLSLDMDRSRVCLPRGAARV